MLLKELESAKAGLEKIGKYPGMKLRYAYVKNMKSITAAMKDLEEMAKPSGKFLEYQQAQNRLKIEHAEKDENGQPKIEGNMYVMKDMNAFIEAAKTLDEAHKEGREEYIAQLKSVNDCMNDEVMFSIHKLKECDLPEDITAEEFAGITFMIEGFDE